MAHTPAPRKRVVLLHRSGLHRIIGEFDPSVHTTRPMIELTLKTGTTNEHVCAELFRVEPRFLLYRQTGSRP